MKDGTGDGQMSAVVGLGTMEFGCLKKVPNFMPKEWILFQLKENLHLVAIGTDQHQNKLKGFFFSVTPDLRILYEDGADLCVNGMDTVDGESIVFDDKMMREELLNFVIGSALKDPLILGASFHPDKVGPRWTDIYVQRVRP